MDEEDIEVLPEEDELFSVDESLTPIEAILRYSHSEFPAQRHAHIQGMGAAALHSISAADVRSLIQLALELLTVFESKEGSHELAGDDLAELLVLQQLGILGHALLQLSPSRQPSSSTTAASSSVHTDSKAEMFGSAASPPAHHLTSQSCEPLLAASMQHLSLGTEDLGNIYAMLDACAQRLSTNVDRGESAVEQLSPSSWPAAWGCSTQLTNADSSTWRGACCIGSGADAGDARSAALLSYAQLLGLLPAPCACAVTMQHVKAVLLAARQGPPSQPPLSTCPISTPAAQDNAPSQAGELQTMITLGLPELQTMITLGLPESRPPPEEAAAALSMLAACGHAVIRNSDLRRQGLEQQAQQQLTAGAATEQLNSGGCWVETSACAPLRSLASQLLLKLAYPSGAAATVAEEDECQMTAVALLPPLATSLLPPTPATCDAVLLPLLHSLASSASWTVRRSVAEVLPVMLDVLVAQMGKEVVVEFEQQQSNSKSQQHHYQQQQQTEANQGYHQGEHGLQRKELQRLSDAMLHLLVHVLGVNDVSHWVRNAATAAAGPALCALPNWLASKQTSLHDLYANAVLAARPHTSAVVIVCASCLGTVVEKVGVHTWVAPFSPFPLVYAGLMAAKGGSGGIAALRATVAQMLTLASVLGPDLAHDQLLPPLMALFPGMLATLRGSLACKSTLARFASILPPAGTAQLLALLPALCSLDEGKEEGRCGQWRERHGLALQIADLAKVALQATSSKADPSASPLHPYKDVGSCKDGVDQCKPAGSAKLAGLSADLSRSAAHVLRSGVPPPNCCLPFEAQMELNQGQLVKLVLHCASILIRDPVWAVRQAAAAQLLLLT